MRFLRYSFFVIALSVCALAALGDKSVKESGQRAKARYFFFKGAEKEAQQDMGAAYEFYKKAFKADPAYPDAKYSFGLMRTLLNSDTIQSQNEVLRSLSYMRPLVDAYPRDIEAGQTYAYYSAMADTLPEAMRVFDIMVSEFPGKSALYLPQAMMYMQVGEATKAVEAMREFERLEGQTSESTLRKVSYFLAAGDTISALDEAGKYADSNPGNPGPILDKAMVYNALGRTDSAIMFLEEVLPEFPDNGHIKFDLALMKVAKGDTLEFHKLVAEALDSEELEYEDRMKALDLYVKNLPVNAKDYSFSDKVFKEMEALYPSDETFLDIYGSYEIMKGDYVGALDKAEKALALDPEEVRRLGRVISYSVLAERPEVGMRAYENFPDSDAMKLYNIALSYVSAAEMAKEYDKAIGAVERFIKGVNPVFSLSDTIPALPTKEGEGSYSEYELSMLSIAYEISGDVYSKMGKKDEAVKQFEKAVSLPVENASVLNNYAYYLIETIKAEPGSALFEHAKELSRKSIDQTRDNPQSNYYDTYAWILFKERNYKDALDYQEVAVDLGVNDVSAELLSHYGDILFMNGRPEEALVQWQKALELDPSDQLLKKKVEHKTYFYE